MMKYLDGFDLYSPGAGQAASSFASGKAFSNSGDPYGFEFRDENGSILSVRIERAENGQWRMIVKGEGEFIFNEPPGFVMAQPL